MRLKIQKLGNSAAIRLPRELLLQIGATIGDVVEIDAKAFKFSRPKYKLDDYQDKLAHLVLKSTQPFFGSQVTKLPLLGKDSTDA